MSKFDTDRVHPLSDAEAVIQGRLQVSLHGLLDLIHRVNPTGSSIRPQERERRYTLKSSLQSLLIRRHGAELIVAPSVRSRLPRGPVQRRVRDPQRRPPGPQQAARSEAERRASRGSEPPLFVRLDCRDGRNACHARLEALDEDARSWVLRQLDEGHEATSRSGPAPAPPEQRPHRKAAPNRHTNTDERLEIGRRALREYDYEAARAHLYAALRKTGGATEPARALLELLVDDLAADEETLALWPGLSDAARCDAEVRMHLGLAAARSGQEELALDLIKGLCRPQVAPILVLLARRCLVRGDLDTAGEQLLRARAQAPTLPDLLEAEEDLRALQDAERRPYEQEALELLSREEFALAEERAQTILRRWPDSTAARRVCRAVSVRRGEREAQVLLAQAEAVHRRGPASGETALTLLSRAIAVCPSGLLHERAVALFSEVEEQVQAAADERRITATLALLTADEGDLRAGLRGYLALDERLRAAVQERCGEPAGEPLRWMDEICRTRPGWQARGVIEATLALSEARALLATDPAQALGLIQTHERHLAHVGPARQILREATHAWHEIRREEEEAKLAQIIRWLKTGEPGPHEEARRLMGELDAQALSPKAQQSWLAWREVFERHEQSLRLWNRYWELRGTANLARHIEARQVLSDLRQWYGGDPAYELQVLLWESFLCGAFLLWVDTTPGPPDELRDIDLIGLTLQGPLQMGVQSWMLGCGREALLVSQARNLIFLRVYCLDAERVVFRASLLTQDEVYLKGTPVDPEGVWLLGKFGNSMRIGLPPGFCAQHAAAAPAEVTEPGATSAPAEAAGPAAAAAPAEVTGPAATPRSAPEIAPAAATVTTPEPADAAATGPPDAPVAPPQRAGPLGDLPPVMLGPDHHRPHRPILGGYDLGLSIHRWHPQEPPGPAGKGSDKKSRRFSYLHRLPHPGYLWRLRGERARHSENRLQAEILETDCRVRHHTLGQIVSAWSVPLGADGLTLVACLQRPGLLHLCRPDGEVAQEIRIDADLLIHAATVHPCGEGLVLVASERVPPRLSAPNAEIEAARRRQVRLISISAEGQAQAPQLIEGSDGTTGLAAATVLPQGLLYLTLQRRCAVEGSATWARQLLCLRPAPGAGAETPLAIEFEAIVPNETMLLQDHSASQCLAVAMTEAGVDFRPLGQEAPRYAPQEASADLPRFYFDPFDRFLCWARFGKFGPRGQSIIKQLVRLNAELEALFVNHFWEQNRREPGRLTDLLAALDFFQDPAGMAQHIVARLLAEFPEHPEVLLWTAHHLADQDDWQQAWDLLRGVAPDALPKEEQQHLHHLRGMALLQLDRAGEAVKELHLRRLLGDRGCLVEALIELATPLPEPLRESDWGEGQPLIRRLHGAVRTADERLSQGDARGALGALDRRPLWMTRELQGMARMASAWLELEPLDGPQFFRKNLTLATFLQAHSEQEHHKRYNLPYPGRRWSDERLDEVRQRSHDWLNGTLAHIRLLTDATWQPLQQK